MGPVILSGRGPLYLIGGARYMSLGGAGYMYDMYGMWYFRELTKLRAYGFQFMCQVFLVSKVGARARAHNTRFHIL